MFDTVDNTLMTLAAALALIVLLWAQEFWDTRHARRDRRELERVAEKIWREQHYR